MAIASHALCRWLALCSTTTSCAIFVSLVAERTISVDVGGQGATRILGMFTRSERNLLQEALNNGERIGRRLVEDNGCSMGCIRLHLCEGVSMLSLNSLGYVWLITTISP